jgi:hypothetical protein
VTSVHFAFQSEFQAAMVIGTFPESLPARYLALEQPEVRFAAISPSKADPVNVVDENISIRF